MDATVQHDLWNRDATLTLSFPARWNTQVLTMGGDGKEMLAQDVHFRGSMDARHRDVSMNVSSATLTGPAATGAPDLLSLTSDIP